MTGEISIKIEKNVPYERRFELAEEEKLMDDGQKPKEKKKNLIEEIGLLLLSLSLVLLHLLLCLPLVCVSSL